MKEQSIFVEAVFTFCLPAKMSFLMQVNLPWTDNKTHPCPMDFHLLPSYCFNSQA